MEYGHFLGFISSISMTIYFSNLIKALAAVFRLTFCVESLPSGRFWILSLDKFIKILYLEQFLNSLSLDKFIKILYLEQFLNSLSRPVLTVSLWILAVSHKSISLSIEMYPK